MGTFLQQRIRTYLVLTVRYLVLTVRDHRDRYRGPEAATEGKKHQARLGLDEGALLNHGEHVVFVGDRVFCCGLMRTLLGKPLKNEESNRQKLPKSEIPNDSSSNSWHNWDRFASCLERLGSTSSTKR
jgi:hypothetical protein